MTLDDVLEEMERYVLQETNREAVDVDHEQTFTLDAGDEIHVATVTVATGNEYWVIGGDTPMTLYRYAELESAGAVLAAHAETVDGLESDSDTSEGP